MLLRSPGPISPDTYSGHIRRRALCPNRLRNGMSQRSSSSRQSDILPTMVGPSKSRPPMSHRKTDLGIPCRSKSAKVVLAKGADVSRNVLNGPGRHENTADDRRRPCPFKPRRLYLLFRSHAMHAVVHARADLENALRSTAAVVEQNDHVGPLRKLDGGSLPRVGVATHGLDDFDWRLGPAYSLDEFGEDFGVAGDLTHERGRPVFFV